MQPISTCRNLCALLLLSLSTSLAWAGSISGTLVDDGSSAAIPSITVEVYDSAGLLVGTDTSDATGAYSVSDLADGDYQVRFNTLGTDYIREWYNHATDQATADTISPGGFTPDIDLGEARLLVGGRISGTVTFSDAPPGQSIVVGAYASGTNTLLRTGLTDTSTGTYTIPGLPAGTYDIYFHGAESYAGQWYATPTAAVPGETKADINALLTLGVGGTLSGGVSYSTSAPVADALVKIYDSGASPVACAITDANGEYTVTVPSPGTYKVAFFETVNFGEGGGLSEWYSDRDGFATADEASPTASGIDGEFFACPTGTLYVDASVSAPGNGTSWSDAFQYLQDALDIANQCPGMTIHVAAGTYYPDESTAGGDTNNRDATFPLINNLAIYGGYPSGGGTRDWKANVTILSGDIDQNDATSDTSGNSLHVVNSWNATLDGFTISGGNADGGGGCPADCGGGLYQYDGGLALSNAIFRANSAAKGGGMYFHDNTESVTLDNLLFEGNSATDGGGVYFSLFSGTLNNITFANNSATNGGAMYNYSYGATIYNSIFWGNSATSGAEVYNDNMTAMLSLDSVLLQGGCGGIVESGIATACNNILTIDPQFVNDAPGGDYRLQNCSPAIDAGDNTIVTAATDLGGNSRIVGGTVDMGAYENTVGACFIGDRVWNDSDGDGVQDAGESGLSGVTLELRNDLCNPGVDCPTTVSGADGTYAFSGIGAGSYIVAVTGGVPTGHVPSYDEDGGNDAQTSVTISTGHPAHATADFGYDLATFTLTLTQAGTGSGSMTSLPSGISCSTTCSATFDYGQSVTLTANAEPGSSFVSWSGDCIGSGDCELLGVTSDKNVGALFTLNTYAFSTAISGSGSVSGSTADGTYDHGTAITLVATPSADSIFAGWSPPTCVDGFNLLADTECTATFEPGAVAPADPQPIPTLSDWMRLLLIALIGGLVWGWRVRNTGG